MNVFLTAEHSPFTANTPQDNLMAARRLAAETLRAEPRTAMRRVLTGLAIWLGLAWLATTIGSWPVNVVALFLIGAGVQLDFTVQGHWAAHRSASVNPRLNEAILWFTHAALLMPGSVYRDLHLSHHRHTRTPGDGEVEFLVPGGDDIAALSYLKLPFVSHLRFVTFARRDGATPGLAAHAGRELIGAAALHAGVAAVVGPTSWFIWCVCPMLIGLAPALIVRSIAEHAGCDPNDPITATRAMFTHPILSVILGRADHHLEHHLVPMVPASAMPEVRRMLEPFYAEAGVITGHSYLRTAASFLWTDLSVLVAARLPRTATTRTSRAWVNADRGDIATKRKWFGDILDRSAARRRLLELYIAGEAYEELHPEAVYIDLLPDPWGGLLRRHLDDENGHAVLFTKHLAALGHLPEGVQGDDDLGFSLLNAVVPDVVAAGVAGRTFSRRETMRYLAFLHALESRSIGDLVSVAMAARERGDSELADDISTILDDERFHATYTLRGVYALATSEAEARFVLGSVLAAEQREYRRIVQTILAGFMPLLGEPTGLAQRFRWKCLPISAALGLASPRLPLRRHPAQWIARRGRLTITSIEI